MHGLENRMPVHGRLLSVVQRFGRRELASDKIRRMRADRIHPLRLYIRQILLRKMERGAKFGVRKPLKGLIDRLHGQRPPSLSQDDLNLLTDPVRQEVSVPDMLCFQDDPP